MDRLATLTPPEVTTGAFITNENSPFQWGQHHHPTLTLINGLNAVRKQVLTDVIYGVKVGSRSTPRMSIGGVGGSGGGTKARTISPAATISTKRPRRMLGGTTLLIHPDWRVGAIKAISYLL